MFDLFSLLISDLFLFVAVHWGSFVAEFRAFNSLIIYVDVFGTHIRVLFMILVLVGDSATWFGWVVEVSDLGG